MKKIFLFLSLLAAGTADAQNISAGLRGGASYWMQAGDKCSRLQTMSGQHISPDIEAFVRRGSGKWAFEGAVGASTLHYKTGYETMFDLGIYPTGFSSDVRNVELTLAVQRDITCPAMKSCPLLSRVHNYIGVTVSGVAARATERYYGDASNPGSTSTTSFQCWTGLSNTLTFDLCKKVQIVSTGFVRIAPAEFFSSFHAGMNGYSPVARAGVQLGGAYRF